MISVQGLTLRYGKRVLFEDVNLKFTPGNCYGIIGANGAGKSTFLRILSGDEDSHQGEIVIGDGCRLAVLKQDHNAFNEQTALSTVIMGHAELYRVMQERDAIYAKENFTDEDGVRSSELETEFADLGGWEAEAEAGQLLAGLGVDTALLNRPMKELEDNHKVRVLLAQALFGNPDVLLLDEPTNGLDAYSVVWLEEFLMDFKNTVIVISHDRHFLNRVCTHIVDIDFSKMSMYTGNYDFWYQSSQLALKQMKDENKRREDKVKELKEFIQRFSSNASKAKQATSRKKLLEKIAPEEIKPSTRRYPYIHFKMDREAGNDILNVEKLAHQVEEGLSFQGVSFNVAKGDKIALSGHPMLSSALLQILSGELPCEKGQIKWGVTIQVANFPTNYDAEFDCDYNLIDWLRQFSKEKEEGYIRGFLGRMLFSGEEGLKKVRVLSGGEKVRLILSRMMLSGANFLLFDEPTNHLDLESITSLNEGLKEYKGNIIIKSRDHELIQTVCNRIIEVRAEGTFDYMGNYDEFLDKIKEEALQVR